MTIENLWKRSAKDVVNLLKNNEISPKEAIDSIIHRINETHNDINAIVTTCEDRALEKIDTINDHMKNHPGFLFGLPVVIKDLTDVCGVKTTQGSPIFKDHIPNRSDYRVE